MKAFANWSPREFIAGIAGIGCLTFSLLIGGLLLGPTIKGWWHARPFNAEDWRDVSSSDHLWWPRRLCMINDLRRSRLLDQMSEEEVLDLLGPPHKPGHPGGARECDIHYLLGPARRFMSMDDEWLFIDFDEQGVVERYWLYED